MIVPLTTSQKALNLLLVDDDDGDTKALERAFRKSGIPSNIARAVDGAEALDILQGANRYAKPPSPLILLVDLNMPKMGGIRFVEAIRQNEDLRRSIIFVLTTSKRAEDKAAAYDLNVAGYIAKATAAEDFQNLVNLLNDYVRIVELP
jgi:CheY-like chemotaxis protein